MPFTLTMPKLSPTMEEGTIVKWHKNVGDFVEAGDLLFEVATDKATVEHNALDAGWLRKIVLVGNEAKVNQPIAIFTEEKNESIEGYIPEGEIPKANAPLPSEGLKQETALASSPTSVQATGTMTRAPLFTPEAPLVNYDFPRREESSNRIKSSPLARKLAKEKGLDLSSLKGSGPGDRIISRDLASALAAGPVSFGNRMELPTETPGAYEEEALTPMRKVISQRLQEAKSFIPHFYVSIKIDAEPLIKAREQLKEMKVKATFNDFIVRAAALSLRQHPNINSGFNSATNSIIRFKTVDISIAVSLPNGLITPIIRLADYKNIGEISTEVKSLATRAKEGKLEPHEYKGGSFTISNLGMYGVSEFIAIINPPQAAILAVSGMHAVPVVRNGQVVPGTEMTLTLSGDHRVIDGVAGAEFLLTLQKFFRKPSNTSYLSHNL